MTVIDLSRINTIAHGGPLKQNTVSSRDHRLFKHTLNMDFLLAQKYTLNEDLSYFDSK